MTSLNVFGARINSCVAPVNVGDRHGAVVGVDVPMRRIQEWLRGQLRFPDKTRCLLLMPFDGSPDGPAIPAYRVFVDTVYSTSAEHWKSVIEPRRIDVLASPLKEYVLEVVSQGNTTVRPANKDGLLMASARIGTLGWLAIVVRESE